MIAAVAADSLKEAVRLKKYRATWQRAAKFSAKRL
jgi:hypothetical protein